MDTLRVSLIVIGILIIGAIYFWGRRKVDSEKHLLDSGSKLSRQSILNRFKNSMSNWERSLRNQVNSPADELTAEDLADVKSIVAERKQVISTAEDVTLIVELTSDQIAPAGEQLFVPVTIIAKHGRIFKGEQLRSIFIECGFYLDASGVFYHDTKDQQGFEQKLLGLANIVEPGIFTEDQFAVLETPGLVLYLHLPAPIEARLAFNILIEKGRQLATLLGGDLCDETRCVLTTQAISHLREKVEAYRFKQKMTQLKNNNNRKK